MATTTTTTTTATTRTPTRARTSTISSSTTTTTTAPLLQPPPPSSQASRSHSRSRSTSSARTLRKSGHASTPNLNAVFRSSVSSSSPAAPPRFTATTTYYDELVPPVPRLPRKQSLSALGQSIGVARATTTATTSAAAASHAYDPYSANWLDPGVNDENIYPGMPLSPTRKMPPPATPGRMLSIGVSGEEGTKNLVVGDIVDVPGNMHGTVKFIGTVAGKQGTFAGVELSTEFKARGKNNGDVDGVNYFETDTPGAGIFLPLTKAARRAPPSPLPLTPTGLKPAGQNSGNYAAYTPPTPGLPKPPPSSAKGRISSPEGKKMRQSLARPESPARRLSAAPLAGRASVGVRAPSKYMAAPTMNRFAQSVRGTAGDPAKNLFKGRNGGGPRSNSALGDTSMFDDDEPPAILQRIKSNGTPTSDSTPSMSMRLRPSSRAGGAADGEIERLRAQLEQRERQLTEQSATLTEMESSLSELQSLIESPDGIGRRGSMDGKNAQQLRAMLREKNERISMLTAEFDAHRADFRSTIDALETASSETQNLYEKRIEELMQEIKDLESTRMDSLDVDTVALQLRQLEELVQELEEGLEDARRGEAEARGEAEFLRGEVERTRAELRRERERPGGSGGGSRAPTSKELEQKEDEIRGLKAIIHSLSRDAVPGAGPTPPVDMPPLPALPRPASAGSQREETLESQDARDKLEHEIEELQSMLNDKSRHEEELDREIDTLRRASVSTSHHGSNNNSHGNPRSRQVSSSLRHSRGTAVGSEGGHSALPSQSSLQQADIRAMDVSGEVDSHSTTATEHSSLWCEMCEANGHDILSCNKLGGGDVPFAKPDGHSRASSPMHHNQDRANKDGLSPMHHLDPTFRHSHSSSASQEISANMIKPLTPARSRNVTPIGPPPVRIIPNPMDVGPLAGRDSGVVDETKWCALCERDGHDSVDCPFEDAF